MIQRFVTTLRALAALPTSDLTSSEGRALVADCADATRLALDCPQHDLTPSQRATLRRLSELLEDADSREHDIAAVVRDACIVLGIGAGEGSARAT